MRGCISAACAEAKDSVCISRTLTLHSRQFASRSTPSSSVHEKKQVRNTSNRSYPPNRTPHHHPGPDAAGAFGVYCPPPPNDGAGDPTPFPTCATISPIISSCSSLNPLPPKRAAEPFEETESLRPTLLSIDARRGSIDEPYPPPFVAP